MQLDLINENLSIFGNCKSNYKRTMEETLPNVHNIFSNWNDILYLDSKLFDCVCSLGFYRDGQQFCIGLTSLKNLSLRSCHYVLFCWQQDTQFTKAHWILLLLVLKLYRTSIDPKCLNLRRALSSKKRGKSGNNQLKLEFQRGNKNNACHLRYQDSGFL